MSTPAKIEQLLRAHNIDLRDTRPGNHATTCPNCSHERKKKKTRCLGVKIDDKGVCWKCSHCGWSGPPKGNGRGDEDYRATHDYHDANGRYCYTKVRYPEGHDPKCRWRRHDGNGKWISGKQGWGTGGKPRLLYRLPEVLAAIAAGKTIALVEGESDADALWVIDIPATCSRDGAAQPDQKPKWLAADSEMLRDAKEIVVLGDHDAPGYAHQAMAARLTTAVVPRVRVLKLANHWPDCPDGGDVRKWLATGHTKEELLALMAKAPDFEAPDRQEETKQTTDTRAKKGGKLTQAKLLLEIAGEAELFHTPDGVGFADLDIKGHRETWPIRSRSFRRWLARRYYEQTGGAPSSEPQQQALRIIEAQAQHDGIERTVSVRVAGLGGKLYLDLADEAWRAVEVDADGWRVVSRPPVRFRRSAGMQPLPPPARGGSVESLRRLLNVQSDTAFVLAVAWVLAALRDCGPYPVLVVVGEQGSAKSTVCGIIRRLIDPNTAPLRALPREERDLFIAATNAHVLAYDNVSGLPPWISDALCRLSTGGGFATRELHTDQDEVLFNAVRPVILNGIEDIVTRPDLADRAVMLTLSPIADDERRTEKEIRSEFDATHPAVLGALLDGVAHGLRMLPSTKLERKPRMADFALWATACEGALDLPCTLEAAYDDNRAQAVETVIEANPVAEAVRTLMSSGGELMGMLVPMSSRGDSRVEWTGTATELLEILSHIAGDTVSRSKHWPGAAHILSGRLRRAASFLRKVGIEIDFGSREGHASNKIIRIAADRPPAAKAGPARAPDGEIPF